MMFSHRLKTKLNLELQAPGKSRHSKRSQSLSFNIKQSGQIWLQYPKMNDALAANREKFLTDIITPGLTSLLVINSTSYFYFQNAPFLVNCQKLALLSSLLSKSQKPRKVEGTDTFLKLICDQQFLSQIWLLLRLLP